MSQTILLVDYEPRTQARVTEALSSVGSEVITAKDVDSAVAACAKTEPRVVLITSVLPRLKIEDAITQLRARAGLRSTPFLVLMSGYSGEDPKGDAVRLGAQDIVSKPFSNDELLAHVKNLLQAARGQQTVSIDTRADVLEALRKSAGLAADVGTVTSEELFGDLLEQEPAPSPAATQRISVASLTQAMAAPAQPQQKPRPTRPDTAVERALEGTLADIKERDEAGKPKMREDTGGSSVDELLSQTLSGLQVSIPKRAPVAPQPPRPQPREAAPARPEPPRPAVPPAPAPAAKAKPAPPPAEAAATPLPGGTPFGQYELQQLIATGGMAEVYRAKMRGVEGFQKIVAIKRILPHLTDNDEFVTMFIDEAKLAAQLQHPNIIHIYDLGKIERSYYIAMEYIDGKDLRSILRLLEEKQTRIPLGPALYISARLAAALDYAHRKKDLQGAAMALVHRDVSPQNVLISFDGDIKLCDFGIAKAASKASHTRAGALKGKLQYMSPEQAWGKDIDHRSDIFSLGLVLYEMVTGRRAFTGDSELSILEQVRAPKLVPPREIDPAIPPQVERVVLKALKEKREDRYQTAAELQADLDGVIQTVRPTPGASELGNFLAEVVGRERPTATPAAPQPRPAAPPPPQPPAPRPVPAQPAARIPVPEPAIPEGSQVMPAPRKFPVGLLVAGLAVVIIAVVAFVVFSRQGSKAAAPGAAPTPDLRQLTAEEVARQAQALGQQPAEQPTTAPIEVAPTRIAAVVPTAVAGAPTPRPQQTATARVGPTAPAAAPPTAAAAAVVPTSPPTAAPPVEPTQAPLPATQAPAPTRGFFVPPPQTVKAGDLIDITEVDTTPARVSAPKAVYPPMAERQRVGGTVVLRVLVDENGDVKEVEVLRGIKPDFGLDRAAVTAVRNWRYKPATKNGVPVKVWFTQTISFQP